MLSAAALVASCSQSSKAPEQAVLNFSILSTENSQNQTGAWAPLLSDMEKATGLTVKPFFGSNYTALIEAMRFKQTDVGWFSNLSGLEAVRRGGGEVFARTTDPNGTDGYNAIVVVKKGSGLTLDKLLACDKSLDFGMGDAKSTSGTLAPMTYLFAPKGVSPQDCFKTVRAANHEANLYAVGTGVVDAATNNSTSITRLKRQDAEAARRVLDSIEIIWTSPRLPEDPLVWRKDLDPAVKAKVSKFLLTYGVGEGAEAERQRKVLAGIDSGIFKAADDSHLKPTLEMEATEALVAARASGDPGKIAAAEAALKAVQGGR